MMGKRNETDAQAKRRYWLDLYVAAQQVDSAIDSLSFFKRNKKWTDDEEGKKDDDGEKEEELRPNTYTPDRQSKEIYLSSCLLACLPYIHTLSFFFGPSSLFASWESFVASRLT
jgi:hypothetical protein